MVDTDQLFKSDNFKGMTSTTAKYIAERLLHCLIWHHGLLTAIVSNRSPQFVSHF
jgi:hypothetical protein